MTLTVGKHIYGAIPETLRLCYQRQNCSYAEEQVRLNSTSKVARVFTSEQNHTDRGTSGESKHFSPSMERDGEGKNSNYPQL